MERYSHRVQYYETDMMGLTHHSNYIRWMEEARVDFLTRIGFPYAEMERRGVISPVRAVRCQYKRGTHFDEVIDIAVTVKSFNGVVLTIGYAMTDAADGALVCTAESEHVFLNREGGFIRLKRDMPDFCATIEGLIERAEP